MGASQIKSDSPYKLKPSAYKTNPKKKDPVKKQVVYMPYKLGGPKSKLSKVEEANLNPINLLQAACEGDVAKTKAIIEKQGLLSVAHVQGLCREGVLLFGESVNTFTWNPLHLAIYFNRLELVKYYFSLIEHGFNAKLNLLGPSQGPDKESGELMFPS